MDLVVDNYPYRPSQPSIDVDSVLSKLSTSPPQLFSISGMRSAMLLLALLGLSLGHVHQMRLRKRVNNFSTNFFQSIATVTTFPLRTRCARSSFEPVSGRSIWLPRASSEPIDHPSLPDSPRRYDRITDSIYHDRF